MSELTLTVLRLGLLVLLWVFVFSVVGVLRTDLYGTRIKRRARTAQATHRAAPVASAPQQSAPSRPRRGTPRTLTVTEGSLAGSSLPLTGSAILIGRNPESALVLDDDFASGRHARLAQQGGQWYVEDLGSTNGTFLDGTKLTDKLPVQTGSTIRIGRTVLELQG